MNKHNNPPPWRGEIWAARVHADYLARRAIMKNVVLGLLLVQVLWPATCSSPPRPFGTCARSKPRTSVASNGDAPLPLPLHRLRGGEDASVQSLLVAFLRVLKRYIFPGNPARERAPPPPPAPPPAPPAAAAAGGGDGGLNRSGSKGKRRGGSSGGVGSVHSVHSKAEFDKLVASARSKQLVVVDFAASWCACAAWALGHESDPPSDLQRKSRRAPAVNLRQLVPLAESGTGTHSIDSWLARCGPCQQIAPKFAAMAAAMPHVRFLKVDVDECKDLSQQFGVKSMPTFKFLKGGRELDEMKGADEGALREKVEGLAGRPDRWASAGGGKKL